VTYRDDRDALRAQKEVLQNELDDAQKRLEDAEQRAAAHEAKDVEDERELARLREEVDALRRQAGLSPRYRRKSPHRRVIVAATAGVVMVATVGAYVAMGTPNAAPDQTVAEVPPVTPAVPAMPATPVTPATPAPPPTTELDRAIFGAVVLAAEDSPVNAGDGCLVDVRLAPGPNVAHLEVRCGDHILFDSGMESGAGISSRSTQLVEHHGPRDALVYQLRYQDEGQRTGPRPQIDVDTEGQSMRVWRDGADPFDVRLYVADRSAPRHGPPLGPPSSGETSFAGRLHVAATPAERSGPVPAWFDEGCELRAHPHDNTALPCRLLLRCGGVTVYGRGSSGYARCAAADDRPDVADDDQPTQADTDPEMHFRWSERRMTVSDMAAGERWQVTLRLEESDACELDDRWYGHHTSAALHMEGLTFRDGALTLPAADSMAYEPEVDVDCLSGRVTMRIEETGEIWDGHFGPGFATLLGRVRGREQPATFSLTRIRD